MQWTRISTGKTRRLLAVLTWLLVNGPALADIELPALFSDGMVLQQHSPVNVWGWINGLVPYTLHLQPVCLAALEH